MFRGGRNQHGTTGSTLFKKQNKTLYFSLYLFCYKLASPLISYFGLNKNQSKLERLGGSAS